jgi:hypothetical protein
MEGGNNLMKQEYEKPELVVYEELLDITGKLAPSST